jgi:hypothetical protein
MLQQLCIFFSMFHLWLTANLMVDNTHMDIETKKTNMYFVLVYH